MTPDQLRALVRTIPDHPKPGILFRDVTTLLLHAQGFASAIDQLAATVPDRPDLVAGMEARGFVVATLEDLGYDVAEAADGAAALVEFRREAPDLVVLDYLMPGMSGADVARAMRGERPEQPILFVSGYSETDAIRSAAPGAALLSKPFRSEALAASVRKVLSGT